MSQAGSGTEPSAHSFWRQLLRASPVILSVTLLVAFVHHTPLVLPFDSAALDSLILLRRPQPSVNVVIVGIDDDDYEKIFKSTSPLNPDRLWELLDAIAVASPAVIGVDIDTSHEEVYRDFDVRDHWGQVVWARGAKVTYHGRGTSIEPLPILGGKIRTAGVALLPRDSDGLVRYYQPVLQTVEGSQPSFAREIARSYGRSVDAPVSPDGKLLLNFLGDRYQFPIYSAGAILKAAEGPAWETDGARLLKGKIVLVGGRYSAARDLHMTPLGAMYGVELTAQAVESIVERGGIRVAHGVLMTLMEILIGVLLVWIHHRFDLGAALLISLLVIPFFLFLGSYVAFSTLAFWGNFVPIFLAVLIHQLYDHGRTYRNLYLGRTS